MAIDTINDFSLLLCTDSKNKKDELDINRKNDFYENDYEKNFYYMGLDIDYTNLDIIDRTNTALNVVNRYIVYDLTYGLLETLEPYKNFFDIIINEHCTRQTNLDILGTVEAGLSDIRFRNIIIHCLNKNDGYVLMHHRLDDFIKYTDSKMEDPNKKFYIFNNFIFLIILVKKYFAVKMLMVTKE